MLPCENFSPAKRESAGPTNGVKRIRTGDGSLGALVSGATDSGGREDGDGGALAPPPPSGLPVCKAQGDNPPDISSFEASPLRHDLRLPRPKPPPPDLFGPVEEFVADAVESRRPRNPADAIDEDALLRGARCFNAVCDLLRKRDDPPLLHRVLLALRTARGGDALTFIAGAPSRHSRLLHLIFKLDPFAPPRDLLPRMGGEAEREDDALERRRPNPRQFVQLDVSGMSNADRSLVEKCKLFYDYSIADAHLNLLAALVSANAVLVAPAVQSVWRLAHQSLDDAPPERVNRVHATLATFLRLCPSGVSEQVFTSMRSDFPFKLLDVERQVWYAHQCLAVLRYAPDLQGKVLELFLDKCLEIDVEIKVGDCGEVTIEEARKDREKEEEDDGGAQDMFDLEIDTTVNLIETPGKKVEEQKDNRIQKKDPGVDEMADKLDALMLILFHHLTVTAKAHRGGGCGSSVSHAASPRDLFRMILPVFFSSILTTHKSKFVQFAVLLLCGLDDDASKDEAAGVGAAAAAASMGCEGEHGGLYRDFAARLIDVVLDPYRETVLRQRATCYLASFVSRASFSCPETACETAAALLRFAEAYMEAYPTEASTRAALVMAQRAEESGGGGKGEQKRGQAEIHSLYYTCCQAAFYVMCFRGSDIARYHRAAVDYHAKRLGKDSVGEDEGEEEPPYAELESVDISPARWERLCSHHLQPLRYCLESVRGEFLNVARVFRLLSPRLLETLAVEDIKWSSAAMNAGGNIAATVVPKAPGETTKRAPARRKSRGSAIRTAATVEKSRRKKKLTKVGGGVGGLGKGSNPLDSFFPFDPYLLRRSHDFVDPYYRHWRGSVEEEEVSNMDGMMSTEMDSIHMNHPESVSHEDEDGSDCSEDDSDQDDSEGDEKKDGDCQHMPMSVAPASSSLASKGGGPSQSDAHEAWEQEFRRCRAHSTGGGSW